MNKYCEKYYESTRGILFNRIEMVQEEHQIRVAEIREAVNAENINFKEISRATKAIENVEKIMTTMLEDTVEDIRKYTTDCEYYIHDENLGEYLDYMKSLDKIENLRRKLVEEINKVYKVIQEIENIKF